MKIRRVELLTSNKEQFMLAAELAAKRGFTVVTEKNEIHIRTEEGALVGSWHKRHSSKSGGWINYTYMYGAKDGRV